MGPGDLQPDDLARARRILGQLLLGRAAEVAFENTYRSEMHAHELELRDLRESRTDTDKEGLPYTFAIVGVPELSGEIVGGMLPDDLVGIAGLVHRTTKVGNKRDFEHHVVAYCVRSKQPAFDGTYQHIFRAHWHILSARKANKLLREVLFKRVYAMRIRGFAQQFRSAELNMRFSLSKDLVELISLPHRAPKASRRSQH